MAVSLCALIGTPATAQVIEFADDGAATTYAGPAVFTASGATPITPPPPVTAAPEANVAALITEAARRNALSPELVSQVAWQESRFRQSAVSPRDAVGVMQLTAGAARDVGVDRYDLAQNIQGGAAYLRRMLDRYRGDVRLALAAYNAGPGAVDRYGGIPPYRETINYVSTIVGRLSPAQASPGLAMAGR